MFTRSSAASLNGDHQQVANLTTLTLTSPRQSNDITMIIIPMEWPILDGFEDPSLILKTVRNKNK